MVFSGKSHHFIRARVVHEEFNGFWWLWHFTRFFEIILLKNKCKNNFSGYMFFSVFAGNTAIFKRKGHTENKVCLVKWFKIRSEHDFLHNIFFLKKRVVILWECWWKKNPIFVTPGSVFLTRPMNYHFIKWDKINKW